MINVFCFTINRAYLHVDNFQSNVSFIMQCHPQTSALKKIDSGILRERNDGLKNYTHEHSETNKIIFFDIFDNKGSRDKRN